MQLTLDLGDAGLRGGELLACLAVALFEVVLFLILLVQAGAVRPGGQLLALGFEGLGPGAQRGELVAPPILSGSCGHLQQCHRVADVLCGGLGRVGALGPESHR